MSRLFEIVVIVLIVLLLASLPVKCQQDFDFSQRCEALGGVAVQKLQGGHACVADDAPLRSAE